GFSTPHPVARVDVNCAPTGGIDPTDGAACARWRAARRCGSGDLRPAQHTLRENSAGAVLHAERPCWYCVVPAARGANHLPVDTSGRDVRRSPCATCQLRNDTVDAVDIRDVGGVLRDL